MVRDGEAHALQTQPDPYGVVLKEQEGLSCKQGLSLWQEWGARCVSSDTCAGLSTRLLEHKLPGFHVALQLVIAFFFF